MLVDREFALSMLRDWSETSRALSVSGASPFGKFTITGKIYSIDGTTVKMGMDPKNVARAEFDLSVFTIFEFRDMQEFDVPRVGSEQSILALRNELAAIVIIEINY